MSVQDREWYREDYNRRRKRIEEEEKRKARQAGADAMWNEVERQRPHVDQSQRPYQYTAKPVSREKQLILTCPNCENQFVLRIKEKHISKNTCFAQIAAGALQFNVIQRQIKSLQQFFT